MLLSTTLLLQDWMSCVFLNQTIIIGDALSCWETKKTISIGTNFQRSVRRKEVATCKVNNSDGQPRLLITPLLSVHVPVSSIFYIIIKISRYFFFWHYVHDLYFLVHYTVIIWSEAQIVLSGPIIHCYRHHLLIVIESCNRPCIDPKYTIRRKHGF